MLQLSSQWTKQLALMPETGMDYQIVSVTLKDGRRFDQTVVVGGTLTKIRGIDGIPFTEDQIEKIVVTHDKRDFDPSDS
jgi:hypothetical protein